MRLQAGEAGCQARPGGARCCGSPQRVPRARRGDPRVERLESVPASVHDNDRAAGARSRPPMMSFPAPRAVAPLVGLTEWCLRRPGFACLSQGERRGLASHRACRESPASCSVGWGCTRAPRASSRRSRTVTQNAAASSPARDVEARPSERRAARAGRTATGSRTLGFSCAGAERASCVEGPDFPACP